MENDPRFTFTKMAIDRVKEYAFQHKCPIEEACGSITGVSLDAYNEAIQFMIRTGYRYNIYNKIQVSWKELDIIRGYSVHSKYPRLYREITVPEISVMEHSDECIQYCLSDAAYGEWCQYQREMEAEN